jgi:hypothetical protein
MGESSRQSCKTPRPLPSAVRALVSGGGGPRPRPERRGRPGREVTRASAMPVFVTRPGFAWATISMLISAALYSPGFYSKELEKQCELVLCSFIHYARLHESLHTPVFARLIDYCQLSCLTRAAGRRKYRSAMTRTLSWKMQETSASIGA